MRESGLIDTEEVQSVFVTFDDRGNCFAGGSFLVGGLSCGGGDNIGELFNAGSLGFRLRRRCAGRRFRFYNRRVCAEITAINSEKSFAS